MLRLLVFALPIVASVFVALALSHLLPDPQSILGSATWWVLFTVGAILPFLVIERLARRLLPLAVLLKLTLLFPDEAPSRFAVARRAGRVRDLKRRVDEAQAHGAHDAPTIAAERILGLIAALGAHDRRTRGHSERVRTFTDLLAAELDLTNDDRDRLRWGALMHDIGKLSVPPVILNKPGDLDEREREIVHRHPIEGLRIAAPIVAWLGPWGGAIEHHHEKWDGTGYPHGLAGEEISLGGRILAVADSYETMTAARPYKRPLSATAARSELTRCAGSHFDPALVRAFLNVSIKKLWWSIGAGAFFAQLPFLGQLSFSGAAQRFGNAAAGLASTALVVGGLIAGGFVGSPSTEPGEIAAPAPVEDSTEGDQGSAAAGSQRDRADTPDEVLAAGLSSGGSSGESPSSTEPGARGTTHPGDEEREQGSIDDRPGDAGGSGDPAGGSGSFAASGSIRLPNPLYGSRGGVSQNEFLVSCDTPSSQGVDGWVFELPKGFGSREGSASVSGRSALESYNLDMHFYSAECESLGAAAGEAPDETAPLPSDTRFILVNQSSGADTQIRLRVTA